MLQLILFSTFYFTTNGYKENDSLSNNSCRAILNFLKIRQEQNKTLFYFLVLLRLYVFNI